MEEMLKYNFLGYWKNATFLYFLMGYFSSFSLVIFWYFLFNMGSWWLRTQCVECLVCLYLILCEESLVMIIAYAKYAYYVYLHRVITKFSLSTSFPIVYPRISETINFLGNPRSNTGNWYQSLVLRLTLYLGDIKSLSIQYKV